MTSHQGSSANQSNARLNKTVQLPNFDALRELAEANPTELESLRSRLCQELIESVPRSNRARLLGIQFQIDMERRRHKNALGLCVKLSQMMNESLCQLAQCYESSSRHIPMEPDYLASVTPLFPSTPSV